jgi:hypothetical protein
VVVTENLPGRGNQLAIQPLGPLEIAAEVERVRQPVPGLVGPDVRVAVSRLALLHGLFEQRDRGIELTLRGAYPPERV